MEEPYKSFAQANSKIEWASILLDNLNRTLTEYISAKPYKITVDRQTDSSGFVFGAHITQPMPLAIPCLIGDICHNLRSALDFCWMGVIRSIEGQNAPKRTMPIQSNVKGLEAAIGQALDGDTARKAHRALVGSIKSHQDFDAGGNTLISALNELSNWQKHNLLIPVASITKLGENTVIKSNDGSKVSMSGARINGNGAVAIGGTEATMSYDTEPTVEITIYVKYLGDREPIIPTLLNLSKAAREAHKAFVNIW